MRYRNVLPLLCVLVAQGCAVTSGFTPERVSEPPARAALPYEHKFFYDSLVDYGDWILIEPYGRVFRPDVNFVAWRPYTEGYWAPSDIYGWIWVSSEPFGWATYHYGQWGYDRFQGWVWQPGVVWAPAWVDWVANDSFVGWAPLMPPGSDAGLIPGGHYVFVPTSVLPSTNVGTGILTAQQVEPQISTAEQANNPVELGGTLIHRGPAIMDIERFAGPLQRVSVEDLVPRDLARQGFGPDASPDDSLAARAADEAVRAARRAGRKAAREARATVKAGVIAPGRLPVVRPLGAPDAQRGGVSGSDRETKLPNRRAAPADTTR